MSDYRIDQVSDQEPAKWNGPKGLVLYYKVKLEDGNVVQIGRKPESSPPQKGDCYEDGYIEGSKGEGRLPTLKGGSLVSGTNGSQPRQPASDDEGQSGWDPFHPKQRLIVRESAIKAAMVAVGPVGGTYGEAFQRNVQGEIEQWTDFFEGLIWKAVQRD